MSPITRVLSFSLRFISVRRNFHNWLKTENPQNNLTNLILALAMYFFWSFATWCTHTRIGMALILFGNWLSLASVYSENQILTVGIICQFKMQIVTYATPCGSYNVAWKLRNSLKDFVQQIHPNLHMRLCRFALQNKCSIFLLIFFFPF